MPGEANLNVVATGDFNADGWTDVAAASTANSAVTVYRGTATGLIRVQRYSVGSSPRGIVVSDVDDDGLSDIATANRASNTISVLLNDPTRPGSFLAASENAADAGSRAIATADFDGDGLADLAAANEYASRTTVLTNTTPLDRAAYAFRATSLRKGSEVCCELPDVLWTADFNRDGKVDIATLDATRTGILLVFADGATFGLPVAAGVSALRVGNFNADGSPDVLYVSIGDPSTVGVFLGDGHGHFTPSGTSSILVPIGYPSIAIGDLNRDGRLDLVSVVPRARPGSQSFNCCWGAATARSGSRAR